MHRRARIAQNGEPAFAHRREAMTHQPRRPDRDRARAAPGHRGGVHVRAIGEIEGHRFSTLGFDVRNARAGTTTHAHPLIRSTLLTTVLPRSCDRIVFRCLMSQTSRSISISRKSEACGTKSILSILPPVSPIVVAITPSAPGSFNTVTAIWVG